MQEKTVLVSGKEVRFRSSAAIPRLYRIKFKRDIFKDLSKLEEQAPCLLCLSRPGKMFQPFHGEPGRQELRPFLIRARNKPKDAVQIQPIAVDQLKPFSSRGFRGEAVIQADDHRTVPPDDARRLPDDFFRCLRRDHVQHV